MILAHVACNANRYGYLELLVRTRTVQVSNAQGSEVSESYKNAMSKSSVDSEVI